MRKNPIIKGLYADPDIRCFGGKYYIYPTTDGNHWRGTGFHCFCSDDLNEWKDLGVIFDITWDSAWATDFAWAPTAAYKNGEYYFYYCANHSIGVAKAENPWGPFQNISVEKPLLSLENLEEGVELSQVIDPYIYIDETGTNYLYFGNGERPAVVKLKDDMVTLIPGTMRNVEFIGDAQFREAVMVIYAHGRYHFTWSCDDTRSEDYHVSYGVSDSPLGPIRVRGTVLRKKAEGNILGTGHHSMVKDDDTGKYFLAYHRFAYPTPKGVKGEERGYNREVCLGEIQFDKEGYLTELIPR